MDDEFLIGKLKNANSEFANFQSFDNLLYMDYGRFGTFIFDNFHDINSDIDSLKIAEKAMNFIGVLYLEHGKEVENLIIVCIFEKLLESKICYEIVDIYFNGELKSLFLDTFPYEEHKDDWDTENYYTAKEFQDILDSIYENCKRRK